METGLKCVGSAVAEEGGGTSFLVLSSALGLAGPSSFAHSRQPLQRGAIKGSRAPRLWRNIKPLLIRELFSSGPEWSSTGKLNAAGL